MIKKIGDRWCLQLKNFDMKANITKDGNIYGICCPEVTIFGRISEVVEHMVDVFDNKGCINPNELMLIKEILKEVIQNGTV